VLDAEMRILAVSEQWLAWLGYNNEAVIGRRITEFMPASSASHFHDQTWKMLHHTGVVRDLDCQFIRSTGEAVDASVSARATLDSNGAPLCVVAAPVDITDRKRSEARFAKLFALSPSPMVIRRLDDSRILDANDAFLTATGHAVEQVVGHSLDDLGLFENRPQRQQFEHDLRVNGRVQTMDVRIKSATGDVLDCLVSADQIHIFGHHCAMLVLQDVTDRRRNEMQLFQAIETVMRDTSWFSRSVIEKLAILRSPPRVGVRSAEIDDLTPREREVLGLISHGLSDTDIAEKLGLTRSTVRNHVATLYSKIDVHSRSSAIVWARERGINIAWPASGAPNFIRRPMPTRKPVGSGLSGKDGRA
jgi:PAS domain S-box-containing protein